MHRVAIVLAVVLVAGGGIVLAAGSGAAQNDRPAPVQAGDEGIGVDTDVPVPRVCWFSDYEGDPPGLANQCRFDESRQEWQIEVRGDWKAAKGRQLPTANLCHYFYGRECPER